MNGRPKRIVPRPGMVITENVAFEPGVHVFGGADGVIIDADDIVVDGSGSLLRSGAPAPTLPAGDHLYTPGDLGVSREEHSLLLRKISLPADATIIFECRSWGAATEPATLSISRDRREWRLAASAGPAEGADVDGGWHARRWLVEPDLRGEVALRFAVPEGASTPAAPLFYDAFRILHGDTVIWQGDAREHWKSWYNTGFSIFKRPQKRFYAGVAIRSTGRRGVHLFNCRAEGFLTGLSLADCAGWTVERNDFSGNYDDPDYGWGEGMQSHGAVFLDRVTDSLVRKNRGRHVWNGISMRRCSGNTIAENDFSRCSNVCLKMSQSADNVISDNVLSWGIRIYPGEVHARDSVSLLVESGSNRNRFLRNDFSHGGDGIFIRVLNHWCSMGNLFESNDCSYANNNAVESWSPGNTYVRNKASWSSYGFWLGGSDDTLLLDNEITNNGKAFQNAPEPFGHAGVSVVHGSSTHFVMAGNTVHDNQGCGVSLAFKAGSPARHWLIAGNRITRSRTDPRGYAGRGILAEFCDDIALFGNVISGSEDREIVLGRSCENVVIDPARRKAAVDLDVEASMPMTAGVEASLGVVERKAGAGPARFSEYSWDFGDGTGEVTHDATARHTFAEAGRRRVTVTCVGRRSAGIASRIFCAVPEGRRLADCSSAEGWSLQGGTERTLAVDAGCSVLGQGALHATVRGGTISTLSRRFASPLDLGDAADVSFFYQYATELFFLSEKRLRSIGVRLRSSADDYYEYMPEYPAQGTPSEDRYSWVFFQAPVASFAAAGAPRLSSIQGIEIMFGPEIPADSIFRLDALMAIRGRA